MPAFQRAYLEKKRQVLEAKLKQQKEIAEREMNKNVNKAMQRKKVKMRQE